jgi:hypothetical protein
VAFGNEQLAWQAVEAAVDGKETVPKSTQRRWFGRLRSSASHLFQRIAGKAASLFSAGFVATLSSLSTRLELARALQSSKPLSLGTFASIAAWIHRLEPGVRLM